MAKKRASNEGTIYQRSDGRWEAKLTISGKRRSFYAKTQLEVLGKIREARDAMKAGLPVTPSNMTVRQFMLDWLENKVLPSTRFRTHQSYEGCFRNHIDPHLGHIRLAKLTPQDVQSLVSKKILSGLAPRTVEYCVLVLSRALNVAVSWGLVTRNVATLVAKPKYEKTDLRVLKPDEAKLLLESASDDRLGPLISIGLTLGLRRGEALGLKWDDIDFDKRTLTVRRQLQRIGGQLVLTDTKTAKSRRTLNVPEVALSSLRKHWGQQQEQKLAMGPEWIETGLVFTSTKGTAYEPRNLTRDLAKLLAKAGLPRFRFHDLRHSCASFLLAQNVSMFVVKEVLGHSQIALTVETYGHILPESKREAADQMDAILGR